MCLVYFTTRFAVVDAVFVTVLMQGFADPSSVLLQDVKEKLVYSLQSPARQAPRQLLQRRPYQHSVIGAPAMSFLEQKQLNLPQKYTVLPPISAYATQPSLNTQRVYTYIIIYYR